jgi:hypothetical protein
MFGTLLGDLPRPPLPPDARPEAILEAVLRAQEDAGLEPLSEAGFGMGEAPADRWRMTSARTERMAKQGVVGPYSRQVPASGVRAELLELAEAGCPYIEVHEPAVVGLTAPTAPTFAAAHDGLLDGLDGVHCSLVITGGNADQVGMNTLLTAPFESVAFDLIDGPENWRLVVATPGERGVVCGTVSGRPVVDQKEVLLWAAEYAASTGGRGMARVGLATAGSLTHLTWEQAIRKLAVLGEAVRLAELPPNERAARLDPRAVDIRSAALGRFDPGPRPRPKRRRG